VAVALRRDVGVDAAFGEVGEVVVRGVAGVGEELLRPAPGVGLDRIDERGQGGRVGRVRGQGGGDDDLVSVVDRDLGVVAVDPAVGLGQHDL
jgi:hypothetical protein